MGHQAGYIGAHKNALEFAAYCVLRIEHRNISVNQIGRFPNAIPDIARNKLTFFLKRVKSHPPHAVSRSLSVDAAFKQYVIFGNKHARQMQNFCG